MFVNDLADSVHHAEVLQFADDVNISREIHRTTDCQMMHDDVQEILNWWLKNVLVPNPIKAKVVSYTRQTSCIEYPYTMLCFAISGSDTIRDLGVRFDSRLLSSEHVSKVVNGGYQVLGVIFWINQNFCTYASMIHQFCAFALSKLKICPVVWNTIGMSNYVF